MEAEAIAPGIKPNFKVVHATDCDQLGDMQPERVVGAPPQKNNRGMHSNLDGVRSLARSPHDME